MRWWKQRHREAASPVVQVRRTEGHPFGVLDRYTPLGGGSVELYRAIREGVPVVEAAVWKLVRLCGGVHPICRDKRAQEELDAFWQGVNTGWGQQGMQAFLDRYLDQLLFTCGHALGEIVLTGDGRDVAAVLCADPEQVEAREGTPPGLPAVPPGGGEAQGAALAGAAPLHPLPAHLRQPLRGVPHAVHALFDGHSAEDLPGHGPELGAGGQPALCGGL